MTDARRTWLVAVRIGAVAALLSAVTFAAGPACDTPDPTAITEIDAPSFAQFEGQNLSATQAGVSRVLELRCGTLDCHGQVGRALRIYGEFGLRFVEGDADNQPGNGVATTQTEYEANYQSVIGLQPEYMTLVYEGYLAPEALLLIRKPLQLERHKGGAVFVSGDAAYECITSWLESGGDAGSTDYDQCGAAAAQ